MNWQIEVIKLIEENFKSIGIKYKPNTDLHICLIDFMNLEMKLVDPKPRNICKSDTLKSRILPLQYYRALNYIENKIKKGVDITFHMSKKALDPTYNDLLMNNWVMQHIHLSDTKSQKGQRFYDRSKYLLFTMFSEREAYFIDIRDHNEQNVFAKQEFLAIVDRNWPHILKEHIHSEAEFFNNQYTDADIDILRRKGYTISTTLVNGKVIANPGIGITTNGHNMHVVKRAHAVLRYLSDSVQEVEKGPEEMKEVLKKETGIQIKELDLCIKKLDNWPFFALYEKNSKCYIEKRYE